MPTATAAIACYVARALSYLTDMPFDPFLERLPSSLARGHREDLRFGFVDFCREFEAIEHENCFRRSVANSLFPSMKG